MVSDWRETGEIIRGRCRESFSDYARKAHANSVRGDDDMGVLSIPAVWLADGFVNGDPSRFTPEEHRRWLWRLPKGHYDDPIPNGRPQGHGARMAATIARYFYDAWYGENKRRGIEDYGHRGEMKDYAARAVVEDLYAWRFAKGVRPVFLWEMGFPRDVDSFIEVVRDLMDKPRHRRDPGDYAEVDFLASRAGLVLDLPPKPNGNR